MTESFAVTAHPRARQRWGKRRLRAHWRIVDFDDRALGRSFDEERAPGRKALHAIGMRDVFFDLALGVHAGLLWTEKPVFDELSRASNRIDRAGEIRAELSALVIDLTEEELGVRVLSDRAHDAFVAAVSEIEGTLGGENYADPCRTALCDESDKALVDGVSSFIDEQRKRAAPTARGQLPGDLFDVFEHEPRDRPGEYTSKL